MIITVSTLMSLLQLIKRFKLHVVKTGKLTPFSLGNIDKPIRISVIVRIKHGLSMNISHFHEIYIAPSAFFFVASLMGLSMQTLK